jgi:hypothetical protein
MKICVLNASNPSGTIHLESDVYVDYRQGRASCFNGQERVKQCTSWHSWPYALETEFFVYNKDKWQGCLQYDAIVILVNREIAAVMPLVKKLKLMKKKVAIAFHEGVQDLITGSGVVNEDLTKRWIEISDLVKEADFYVNLFGQMQPFFEGWFGKDKVKYCSHGAPMDWNHGFTKPWDERPYDILVGTRTFGQRLSRNTLVTLGTLNGFAKTYNKNVHYLSEDGDVSGLLKRIGIDSITVHQGPLAWGDWVKFLSQFKVIAHFDQSMNLGQICYDAAMVDVVPVGSITWNNIQLKTGDDGDLDTFCRTVDWAFEYEEGRDRVERWKKNIHPDAVKKNLLEIFE